MNCRFGIGLFLESLAATDSERYRARFGELVGYVAPPLPPYELVERTATLPIRIFSSETIEEPDFSSHRLRCNILRPDVEDGALALIINRHQMATRRVELLEGKKHLRPVAGDTPSS